jgi:hypothetical protein
MNVFSVARCWVSLVCAALFLSGCASQRSSGLKLSRKAIAFLDERGVTRDEVIANLGQPAYESAAHRVLLYVRTISAANDAQTPAENPFGWTGSSRGNPVQRALFVSYDTSGAITGHEVSDIEEPSFEEAVTRWISDNRKASKLP